MTHFYKRLFLPLITKPASYFLIFSFYLLFLANGKVICQAAPSAGENTWYIALSPCVNKSIVIDTKFSDIPFSGITPGIGGFVRYKRRLAEHELLIFYSLGDNEAKVEPQYNLNQTILNIDYSNLYSIHSSTNNLFECKVGGIVQVFYANRVYKGFINQNHSFESALSLGGNIKMIYKFAGKLSGFAITNRVTVPFIFGYSTPDDLNSSSDSPESKNNSDMDHLFTYTKLGGIGRLVKIKNFTTIERTLNQKFLLALTYNWDYYKIETGNTVIVANHQLGISCRYKFK